MARRNSIHLLIMIAAAVAYLALVILAAPAAHATVYTWDNTGTGMTWATAANWNVFGQDPVTPPTGTDTAAFTGAAAGTVTLPASPATSVGAVNFTAGGYTLSGGTISLGQNLVEQTVAVSGGTNTISAVVAPAVTGTVYAGIASGTLNITGSIGAGTGGVTKGGAGTLNVSSNNGYTGATTITGGTMTLSGANGALASTASIYITGGTLTLDNGSYNNTNRVNDVATIAMRGGTINLIGNASGTAETLGNITVSGGQANIMVNSTGTLNLGTVTFGNDIFGQPYGADVNYTIPTGGAITTKSTNTNGILGTGNATVNGTDWAYNVTNVSGGSVGAMPAVNYTNFVATGGTATVNYALTGSASGVSETVNTLKITTNGTGQSLAISGTLTLTDRGVLFVGANDYSITGGQLGATSGNSFVVLQDWGSGTLTITSHIAGGSGGFVKAGSGTAVINQTASGFYGEAYVDAGTLRLGGSSAIDPRAALAVGQGAIFDMSTYNNTFANGNGKAGVYSVILNGGSINGSSGSTLTLGGTLAGLDVYAGSGVTSIAATTVAMGSTVRTFNVNDYPDILTVSSGITGTAGLTKTGSGTLSLTGNSNYSGTTTVSAGILVDANANGLGTSSVVVSPGAQLQLSGGNTFASAALSLSNDAAYMYYGPGALRNTSGANTWQGVVTLATSSVNIGVDAGSSLNLSGQVTGASYGFTKVGGGNLILSNITNNYGGNTTLSEGQLTLSNASGSALGTGNLNLNGGTLASGATGLMTGSVNAGTGAHTIKPGGSAPGVLTTGTLNLSSLTTLDFSNLTSSSTAKLVSTGSLNFSGGGAATLVLPAGLAYNNYTLIDATSSGTVTNASSFSVSGGLPSGYTLSWNNTTYDLILNVAALNYWKNGGATTNWNDSLNWNGSVPNVAGAMAPFTGQGTSTVTVDIATTAGQVQYASAIAYSIVGPGALTLANTGGVNAVINLDSASLAQVISAPVALGTNLTIGSNANGLTMSGGISEATAGTSITLTGGTLIFQGTNSYTGNTNVNAGLLQMGSPNAAAPGSTLVLSAGGTFDLNSNNQVIGGLSGVGGTVTSSGAAALTVNQAGTTTFGGRITGAGLSLVKSGTGSLTISGVSNNYAGGTTLANGNLILSNASGSALGTGGLTLNGGTLSNVGSTGSLSGDVSAGSGLHTISPGGSSAQGVLHTGSLFLNSSTTLDFSQITSGNTTTLDQIIAGGSLNFSGSTPVQVVVPTNLTLGSYPVITFTSLGGGVTTSNFAFSGGTPLGYSFILDAGDLAVRMTPNNWVGTGSATWNTTDTGNWSFSTVPQNQGDIASFAGNGNAAVPVDGTITIGAMAFDGSQPYNIQPGTSASLVFWNTGGNNATISMTGASAAQTISVPVTLSSDLTISNNSSNSLMISGGIAGSGRAVTLTSGLLVLAGTNTYSGNTNVTGGTLRAGSLNAFSPNSALVMSAGGTADLASNYQTIGGLSGTGGTVSSSGAATLTVNQLGSTVYSGLITGAVGLTMSGGGTLQLNAANTYTGATNINQGTVTMGVAAAVPTAGGIYINAGGMLNLNGQPMTPTGLNLAGGTLGGSGTLSLASTASLTGYGTITGGVLSLSGGSLAAGGSNTLTVADQITGTPLNVVAGAGTVVLSNSTNSFTGTLALGTTAAGATLASGASSVVPTGVTVNLNAGTWNLNGYYNKITNLSPAGTGTVNLGGGTLEMSAAGTSSHYVINGTGTSTFILDGGELITDNGVGQGSWTVGSVIINGGIFNVAHGEGATYELNASDITINTGGTMGVNGQGTSGMGLAATTKIHMNGGTYDMASTHNYDTKGGNQVLGGLDGSSGTVSNNSTGFAWTLTINQVSGINTYGGQLTNGAYAMNLIKSGGGTWILNNASATAVNNYTGTTQVLGGTLQLGANNQIPDASLFTVGAGSTFDLNNHTETINTVAVSGGTLAGTGGGTLTYANPLNISGGSINAQLAGTGLITISGTGTTLMGGSYLPTGAPLTLSGGTMDLNSYNQTVTVMTLAGGTLAGTGGGTMNVTTSTNLQGGLLNTPLGGSAPVAVTGPGTVLLGGAYLPTGSALTVGAGTLDLQAYTQTVNGLTMSGGTLAGTGGGILNFGPNAALQAGTISAVLNGGTVTKSTPGTVVLTAANTFTGGTTVSNGVLQLAASPSTVVVPGAVTLSGGTLAGVGTISGDVSAGSGAHRILPTGTLTMGNLYLSSLTTLDFSNFGSGGYIVSTGTLNVLTPGSDLVQVVVPSGLAPNTYTLIDANPSGNAVDANFAVAGGRAGYSLAVSAGDLILTIQPNFWKGSGLDNWSDSGNWNVAVPNVAGSEARFTGVGDSTVVVDAAASVGAVSFDGSTPYNIQGLQTLTFDNAGAGNATITMTSTAASQTFSAPVALASDLTVTSNANGVTFSGGITGGSHGITLAVGLLVLSGANSYSGNTNVNAGTLQMGSMNAASSASTVVLSAGGTFDLNTFNQVIGGLSGAGGTVTNNSTGTPILDVNQAGPTTFGGLITGAVALTKDGAGALTLSGVNSYTGDTIINAGTLKMGVSGAVPATTNLTMSNGTFDMNGNNETLASLSGAGGTVTSTAAAVLTINQAGTTTFGGLIGGAVALTKSGAGVLVLGTANNYTGATNISQGTVQLGVANALSMTSTATINSALLDLQSFNQSLSNLNLNGGSVTGTGTLKITTASPTITATGIVSLSGGTLVTSGRATFSVTNVSDTLYIGDAFLSNNGVDGGTSAFIKTGAGTLVFSSTGNIFPHGDNALINAGTLRTDVSRVLPDTGFTVNAGILDVNSTYQVFSGLGGTGTVNLHGGTIETDYYGQAFSGTTDGTGTFIVNTGGADKGADTTNNPQSFNTVGGLTMDQFVLRGAGKAVSTNTGAAIIAGSVQLEAGSLALELGGSGTVVKTTTGTVLLGIASALSTSPLTVNNGILNVQTFNQTVPVLTMAGGTLTGTTGTVTIGTSANVQAGWITAILGGAGSLLKSGTGLAYLGGTNTYSGDTSVTNGVLRMTSVALPSASALNLAGGTFESAGGMTISRSLGVSGPGSIRWTAPTALSASNGQMIVNISNGPITWDGSNGFLASGQALTFGAATSNSDVTLTSDLNLAGAIQTVTVNAGLGGDSATLSGHLTAGGLTKNGLGVLVLTNPLNDYAMGTNVSVGTLRLGAVNVLPGDVTVSTGATLDVGANDQHNLGAVNLAGGTIIGSGTLYASGSYTVTSGTINVNLAGAGGLQVLGNTVVLNGTNTYAGDTVISGGTLKLGAGATINNSAMINVLTSDAVFDVSAAAPYTILPGQTLKGHGSVIGDLVIQGKVAPGDSPGTITVTGNVEYGSGSELDIELAGVSSYSQLISTGTVTLDPGSTLSVTWTGLGDPNGDIFDVVQGQTVSGAFGTVNLTGAPAGETLVVQTIGTPGSGQVVELQVIPEPATLVLLGFGLAGVVGLRRRNRKA